MNIQFRKKMDEYTHKEMEVETCRNEYSIFFKKKWMGTGTRETLIDLTNDKRN